jgi:hypothetical protein
MRGRKSTPWASPVHFYADADPIQEHGRYPLTLERTMPEANRNVEISGRLEVARKPSIYPGRSGR